MCVHYSIPLPPHVDPHKVIITIKVNAFLFLWICVCVCVCTHIVWKWTKGALWIEVIRQSFKNFHFHLLFVGLCIKIQKLFNCLMCQIRDGSGHFKEEKRDICMNTWPITASHYTFSTGTSSFCILFPTFVFLFFILFPILSAIFCVKWKNPLKNKVL